MAQLWLSFPLRGCVIPLRATWDKKGPFGVYFYQKDQEMAELWPFSP